MNRHSFIVFFSLSLLLLLLLAGCSSLGSGYGEYAKEESAPYASEPETPPSPAGQAKRAAPMTSRISSELPAESMLVDGISETAVSEPAASPLEEERQEEQQERLRIYSGSGRLIVEDVDETKEAVSAVAEENGGYVEGIWENMVVIRVPAELFFSLFDEILALGEVESKHIETLDVTEYFNDTATRLNIAETTRERLYALLEKTEDLEERLKILREIRRLTEEIEGIKNRLRTLKDQIAFSRIRIELRPRLSEEAFMRDNIPFPWIADLQPLYPGLRGLDKKPELPLDESFAVFSDEDIFRAENPEGVRIRISRTPNNPKGDTAFWRKALSYHLGPLYAGLEQLEFRDGEILGVHFTSKDSSPFHYIVALRTGDEYITVLEAFFPDDDTFSATKESVYSAFEGVVIP